MYAYVRGCPALLTKPIDYFVLCSIAMKSGGSHSRVNSCEYHCLGRLFGSSRYKVRLSLTRVHFQFDGV